VRGDHPNYSPSARILPPIASTSSAILEPEAFHAGSSLTNSPSSDYVLPDPSPDLGGPADAMKAKRRSQGPMPTVAPQRSSYVAGSRPPFSPGIGSPAMSPIMSPNSPRIGYGPPSTSPGTSKSSSANSSRRRLSKPPPAPSANANANDANGLAEPWELVEEPHAVGSSSYPAVSAAPRLSPRLYDPLPTTPPVVRTLGSKSSTNYLATNSSHLLSDPSTQAAAELATWDPSSQPHPGYQPTSAVIASQMTRHAEPPTSPAATGPEGKPSFGRRRSSQPGTGTVKSVIGGIFGGVSDLLTSQKGRVEISTPYNPVHLTHVGYNNDTGEFTVRAAQSERGAHVVDSNLVHRACRKNGSSSWPRAGSRGRSRLRIRKPSSTLSPSIRCLAIATSGRRDIKRHAQDATKKEMLTPGAEEDAVWQKMGAAAATVNDAFENPVRARMCSIGES
jgi:hypothetical protein